MRLAPLLAVVLWGGIYPASKLGLREISPLAFTALRLAVASLVLLAASRGAPRAAGHRPVLLAAGAAQAAFQLLLIASLARTTAGNSAVLLATAPLLTAAWVALVGRTPLGGRRWAGLVLGFAGVALVVGSGAGLERTGLAGGLLALGAAGAWAAYSLVIGSAVAAVGPLRATAWTMLLAALVVVPLSVPSLAALDWRGVSAVAWVGLLYGSTAGMAVAMALWGWAVARLGATRTMAYIYLEPVSAVVLAAVLLAEVPGWQAGVGALLALTGVWLAESAA